MTDRNTQKTENPEVASQSIKAKKPIWRHLLEIGIILLIGLAIMKWQERHLLSNDEHSLAPQQNLISLDGQSHSLPVAGQKQLIYFFAPWCNVCHLSIGNIESQKEALLKKGYQVRYVGLDWQSKDQIIEFAQDTELTFPVLLGTKETMSLYQVKGFPTYYLIDEQGQITAGSQGYSTSLGVWLRSL